jgi:hypothetical protein
VHMPHLSVCIQVTSELKTNGCSCSWLPAWLPAGPQVYMCLVGECASRSRIVYLLSLQVLAMIAVCKWTQHIGENIERDDFYTHKCYQCGKELTAYHRGFSTENLL